MARKLLDSTTAFAMWSPEAASNIKKTLSLNMTGMDVAKDQLIQLYYMIYPFIASEFTHRDDIQRWATDINNDFSDKIDTLNSDIADMHTDLQSHVHIGNMGSPTSASVDTSLSPIIYTLPQVEIWTSLPEDDTYKHGESQVTTSSSYTKNILHRNPSSKAKNYNPAQEIEVTAIFDAAYKFVPFDQLGTELDTGDSNFINRE